MTEASSATRFSPKQIRFALRIARRFARSRSLARSTSIVLVAASFVVAMFIVLATLSLSGAQVAQRDLGRFEASVGYGSVMIPPGDDWFVEELQRRVERAALDRSMIGLSAIDMQLPTTPARNVTLLEGDWRSEPYPDRYGLLSGRWPSRPGEVVVTDPNDVSISLDSNVSLFGNRVTLRVVGIADDRFATTSTLLAASGTWAVLDPAVLKGFPDLGAQPYLLWSGEDSGTVVGIFGGTVDDWRRLHTDNAAKADPVRVAETLISRSDLLATPQRSWIDQSPAGYTVPSLLLPVTAVFLVFGVNDSRLRRSVTSLVALGVRPTVAASGLTIAVLTWCLVMAATGVVVGAALGMVARPVIAGIRDKPAGPVEGLATPALRLIALIVLAAVCIGIVRLRVHGKDSGQIQGRERDTAGKATRLRRDARHLIAIASWCVAAIFALQVNSPPKAVILTGMMTVAVLLSIPDFLAILLRVLSEREPRQRLARRQLAANASQVVAALSILTFLFGSSLGYLILFSTMIRTADQQAYPDVLPGQALVGSRSNALLAPSASVLQAVENSGAAAGLPRVTLHFALTIDDSGTVTRSASLDGRRGSLLVVDAPEQVEQIIGHSLSPEQLATIATQGLLVWTDSRITREGKTSRDRLVIKSGDKLVGQTSEVHIASVEVSLTGWRIGTDGVMLRSTAQKLGLPISGSGPQMITGLSDPQAKALQATTHSAGLDSRTIQIYVPPPPPVPPAALTATAVALVVLTIAASSTAARSQARALRGYLSSLIAIGVRPSWARQVLLYQHGVLTSASTLFGLVIATVPSTVLVIRTPGFELDIPWSQLLILLTTIFVASTLTAVHSTRRLRVGSSDSPL